MTDGWAIMDGAMLRYENNIWSKPSVDLTRILRFIHHELTVMEK